MVILIEIKLKPKNFYHGRTHNGWYVFYEDKYMNISDLEARRAPSILEFKEFDGAVNKLLEWASAKWVEKNLK